MNDREKRLIYRSHHRGCKETDVLFMRITEALLPAENDKMLCLLEKFCDEDDADIYRWIARNEDFPDEYPAQFVEKIRTAVIL